MLRKLGQLSKFLRSIFVISLPLSLILYIIRGLGFLGFLSGGIILFCFFIGLFSGLGLLLIKTYI